MSDIRFNRWLHNSGTGGVTQDSSGNIGIGSSVPRTALDVVGIVSATSFSGALTGNVTGNATGLSGTPNITVGNIIASSATISGNVSVAGTLTYEDVTNVDSVGLVTARTGVRIDAGGLVVVGVTTVAAGSTAAPSITPTGDSNTGIFFPSADTIAFGEGGSEALRINSSGGVQIANGNLVFSTAGTGIDFSANANASGMTSELLDDYEEGTWTPIATSSSGSITSYLSGGNYTKIGDTVRVNGYINITNQGSAGGQYLNSSGLPFTSSGGIIPIGVYREQAVNGFLGTAQITDGSTTVYFLRYDNSGQIINGNFHFTITYKTST